MADLTGMMQAAAGAAGGESLFIEDVFSTFLYTGTGSAQTITNGIDLDGEGGLVWIKGRSGSTDHAFYDTARGATFDIASNTTAAQTTQATGLTSFGSTGFSIGALAKLNTSAATYCSWTFRKAPKFFDVVTYTGNGVAGRTVAHNLDSTPGWLIVKKTSGTDNWFCWHRNLTDATFRLLLNSTAAETQQTNAWNSTAPTSTVFTLGDNANVNESGATYVAYLFAHDDGGFGDDGTENVITCGSYVGNGSADGPTVNLGYEPQWVVLKNASSANSGGIICNWRMYDNMRGWTTGGDEARLFPNLSDAENTANDLDLTATGFKVSSSAGNVNGSGETMIFIAIRRGPMKTPTAGTEVFTPQTRTGTGATANVTGVGFAPDSVQIFDRANAFADTNSRWDKLRGVQRRLNTASTEAEVTTTTSLSAFLNDGVTLGDDSASNESNNRSGVAYINYFFLRAPGFFDEVCYTGTGANRTVAHNLGVVPELMIVKKRSATDDWAVYAGDNTDFLLLNTTAATADDNTYWNDTSPTSTVFSVGTNADVNTSAAAYVAYLFASLAGVQDIGTYTGNGTSLTVTTGFQPRFILVKRTNSTGNWIVGDSARGLVAGNDPALFLNSSGAETTGQDWVDVSATGFTVNETALNANVNAGIYLYLAIS